MTVEQWSASGHGFQEGPGSRPALRYELTIISHHRVAYIQGPGHTDFTTYCHSPSRDLNLPPPEGREKSHTIVHAVVLLLRQQYDRKGRLEFSGAALTTSSRSLQSLPLVKMFPSGDRMYSV